MKKKIMLAAIGLLAAIALVRALSDHLPLGLSGRQLLARQVDAYDLSHDGKRIAIVSGGKLQGINVDGSMNREHPNAVLAKPGYTSAEICWSLDDLKIAAAICYTWRDAALKILDLNADNAQEISRAFALGNPVWLEDSSKLAWIQQANYSKSYIYIWRDGGQPTKVYGDEPAGFFWLKMIPGNDSIGFTHGNYSEEPGKSFNRLEIMQMSGSRPHPIPIPAPPGTFPIFYRGFRCWDISADGKFIAYQYAHSIWLIALAHGSTQVELSQYRPLEMKWSPDGSHLAFVKTSPESGKGRPIALGQQIVSPPHELHLINKDGSGHRLVCTEPQGIKSIEWLNNNEVLYLSGKDLYKRGL